MKIVKNGLYELTIEGMTAEGSGIGRLEGYTVFVPATAVGDICRVRLVKCQKSYGYGRLEKLLSPSADRVSPDCAVFTQCGGCAFRHITYEAELKIKQGVVQDVFSRIGGMDVPVEPILGSRRTAGYRNKAQYPIGELPDGRLTAGFYARRSHRIVPMGECALQPPIFSEIIRETLDWLSAERLGVYHPATGKGLVRHIYLRLAEATGEIMLCLVVAHADKARFAPLAERVTARFPAVKSVVLNQNFNDTNVILGEYCVTVAGSDTITDILCGVRVKLSPQSFYQVNREQAERLYETAFTFAEFTRGDCLLDLYCGAGTIGLAAAGRVGSLIGVEIVPQAIENAKENARQNGIENTRFLCGDAGAAAARLAEEGVSPDVIIVDPPRKGLDETVIAAMAAMAPARLVMVSCNPATAARDCALLRERGYAVKRVAPVDLFPRTGHVECVVELCRK